MKIVDVDDVYNEFNDGLYHPVAIKNFLKYAYANWQPPAPTYVLLVGDGAMPMMSMTKLSAEPALMTSPLS